MRIAAIGDIHMALDNWARHPAREAELLLVTGDLTNFGHRAEAERVLSALRPRQGGRLLAVPGNLDHREVGDYLTAEGINLHGRGMVIDGVGFFGVGGSNPTPFHTPLEFSEEELYLLLTAGHRQVREAPIRILVSHAPPHGTRTDRLGNGTHAGSTALRRFIEEEQPDLCLCGHIHEARGEEVLGRTRVLNPGMLKDGGWVGISINHSTVAAGLEQAAG